MSLLWLSCHKTKLISLSSLKGTHMKYNSFPWLQGFLQHLISMLNVPKGWALLNLPSLQSTQADWIKNIIESSSFISTRLHWQSHNSTWKKKKKKKIGFSDCNKLIFKGKSFGSTHNLMENSCRFTDNFRQFLKEFLKMYFSFTLKCTVMLQGRAVFDAWRSNSKPIG